MAEDRHFWLLASFVGVILLVVLGGVSMCALYAAEIVAGRFVCDKNDRLLELLMLAYGAISLRGSGK
jgi:hypothetical protein